MSITLLTNISNVGTAGQTVSIDPSIEADLVHRGAARYVSQVGLNIDPVVRAVSNPVTGGIDFSDGNSNGLVGDVLVVGGTADDALEVVEKLSLAVARKAKLRFRPGVTYTFRNVQIPGGVTIDARGASIQYGGSYGTVAPLENVKVVAYAEGTELAPLEPISIIGGTWIGAQIPGNYNNVTDGSEHDCLQFNYVNGVVVSGATFKKIQQDAITFANCPGSQVIGCVFEDICDGSVEFRAGSDYLVSGNFFTRVRHIVVCKVNINNVRVTNNNGSTFQQGIVGHGNDWVISGNTIGVYDTPDGILGNSQPAIEWSDYGGLNTPTDTYRTVISGNTIKNRTNSNGVQIKAPISPYVPYDIAITDNAIECRRGILLERGIRVVVDGNTIKGGAGGAIQVNSSNVADLTITCNSLAGEPSTSGNGVVDVVTPGVVIANNRIKTTTAAATGIRTTSAAVKARISGNTIDSTTGIGIVCNGANSSVAGNSVTTTAAAAIDVSGASSSVSGNCLTPTGGEGVLIKAARASVVGNAISSGTQGVRVGASGAGAAASNSIVVGNTITGCQFWGVNVTAGAVDTIINGNNLVGNTSGGLTDAGTTTAAANNKP